MARATWDWEGRIGRRVRLRDLHILSAVVRWGSMAKSATHLGMSQSAVSEAISSLEDALRVPLLDRNSQGVEPTIYADALLRRAHAVFDELQQGIKDIEFLADPSVGEVRIGCPEFLSVSLLPSVIEKFSRQYPQVKVHVYQSDARDFEFRELHERHVDLRLARIPRSFVDDELEVEILFEDPHAVVVGRRNPLVRKKKIILADLADERWIIPPWPSVAAVVPESFKAEGLPPPRERVVAASVYLRLRLLAGGRYVAVMPRSVLRGVADTFSLKVLPVKLPESDPIAVIRLRKRALSPVAQVFLSHLKAVAASM
jgi:DNA-binding transcriptional LysR family regulator